MRGPIKGSLLQKRKTPKNMVDENSRVSVREPAGHWGDSGGGQGWPAM